MIQALIVIASAALNLGNVQEAEGTVERTFELYNEEKHAITMVQGYTSCGCTTVEFPKNKSIGAGETTTIKVKFNPRGRSGEFFESATIQYIPTSSMAQVKTAKRKMVQMSIEGTCTSAMDTMLKRYPIAINNELYLSANKFDVGMVRYGQKITRHVSVWNRKKNTITNHEITYTVEQSLAKGINHVPYVFKVTNSTKKPVSVTVTLDMLIR